MKKIILLLLFFTCRAFPQGEFLVNTTTDSTQRAPRIAGPDLNGNYVAVWQSFNESNDIYLQKFDKYNNKTGPEIRVNDITDGEQERPAVAMNKNGSFVVVWASGENLEYMYDIKAKVFLPNSSPSQEFLVNKTRLNTQTSPDVAIDENGNFTAVWESWFQDGSDRGIYARRFLSTAAAQGDEFQVNTTTQFSQARPCIRYFNDGRFIVSWESWTNSQGYDVYAQVFNKDGAKINGELNINTTNSDNQWYSNIAVNSDNSFTILWCSWEQDGDDGGIYLQRFKPDYSKSGGEIRVNATTKYYQWLPRAKYMQDGKLAVVWSSWQTDLSREGVYYAVLDSENRLLTKERRGNYYFISFQWEPDIMITNEGNLVLLWSTWGQYNKDYDVVSKFITPLYPEEVVKPSALGHPEGQSSTELIVHVLDKTKLTGHSYEASFDTVSGKYLRMKLKDITTGYYAGNGILFSLGENVFYMTDEFDGLAIEIKPRFRLELDTLSAHVVPSSKTNIRFTAGLPKVGSPLLSPIDAAIIWGKTDTLSGGAYASPSDTALNASSKKVVLVPFKAWSITQNKKLDLLVMENTATKNNRWDSGETIIILTPQEYRKTALNTHAQLTSFQGTQNVIMPSEGDTMFIRTLKPLSGNDKYTFTALQENLTLGVSESGMNPKKFVLEQNYPNPFNPSTTIRFFMPEDGIAELKIYDMLGREVKTLTEGFLKGGIHFFKWNGLNSAGTPAASGIYIYRMRAGSYSESKKMILTK